MGGTLPSKSVFNKYANMGLLKSVHDEGFMKPSRKIDLAPYGYAITHSHWSKWLFAEEVDSANYAGKFYFDTAEHAKASLDKHRDEWKIIANYDWSRE